MKLPTWDELQRDSDQLDILEYPLDQALFVAGPPGSGKTVLAVKRAQMLLENGTPPIMITFHRMLRRMSDLLSDDTISAKTMHSFLGGDYRRRSQLEPPMSGSDAYDWNWKEMLSILATREPDPKEDHLIIDEGQDLPADFFRYANLYAADVLTVFADDDQALSDRRTTLEEIKDAGGLPNPRLLKANHRNAPEIAKLAEHFHAGRLPAAIVQRKAIGTRPSLVQTQGPDETAAKIATWFRNRGGSIGVIVSSNRFGAQIEEKLKAALPDVRVDRYDHRLQNEGFIDVSEAGVTILNRESVKGQEFDSVFVLELERLLPWQTDTMRRVLYMICARARDHLVFIYGPSPLSTKAASQLPSSEILERS